MAHFRGGRRGSSDTKRYLKMLSYALSDEMYIYILLFYSVIFDPIFLNYPNDPYLVIGQFSIQSLF